MTRGLKRYHESQQSHFVTFSCYRRLPHFGSPELRHRFWQARYYDFNVKTYEQFVEKLRYIHRNPVTRGLVERPEDWPWSSFGHYASGADAGVEIESERTARDRT